MGKEEEDENERLADEVQKATSRGRNTVEREGEGAVSGVREGD
jgi:hypothetical protein